MSLPCEKTGCQVYLEEYGEWALGDAFVGDDFHIFRLSARHVRPLRPDAIHYTVHSIEHWFGEHDTVSTMLVYDQNLKFHGYEGVPVNGFQK